MKKILTIVSLFAILGSATAFVLRDNSHDVTNATTEITSTTADSPFLENGELRWYTWEEAAAANAKNPKKIFVDVYTDWCGWCKVMDKKTFTDAAVKEYMAANFYPVKLDAEQKETINWNGNAFEWRETGKKGGKVKGINMLAYSLLEGKMSYPTVLYLNEKFERIMVSPGYKTPEMFLPELKFAGGEHYKTTTWEAYKASN